MVHGFCFAGVIWGSPAAEIVNGIWHFFTYCVVVLTIMLFCYGRIVMAIRRQASVMVAHSGPGASTAPTQSNQTGTELTGQFFFQMPKQISR